MQSSLKSLPTYEFYEERRTKIKATLENTNLLFDIIFDCIYDLILLFLALKYHNKLYQEIYRGSLSDDKEKGKYKALNVKKM